MANAPVVIIHGNPDVARSVYDSLIQAGYPAQCWSEIEPLLSDVENNPYALLIVDELTPMRKGQTIYSALEKRMFPRPIILVSEEASVQRAVQAIQMGASDYLTLPVEQELVLASVAKVFTQDNGSPPKKNDAVDNQRPLITRAKCMQQLLAVAQRVSDSTATVMIQGESGTGKELLARYIHLNSPRRNEPFVAINCAALPENLAESELFGYQKGAFTGAAHRRAGKFEQAEKGTLLLDEISEMPLPLQAKLLRVLQEKEVDSLGGQRPIRVDVRCIATSNLDLAALVREKRFREDLYFRLRVIPMTIPPLRERKEDIPHLVEHFIQKYCRQGAEHPPHFDETALDYLSKCPWPGNVRELENTVERALLINDGVSIGKEDLLMDHGLTGESHKGAEKLVGMTVKELEQKLIGQTLIHLNHNRTHAAKMLGISIRTLRNKLHEYQGKQGE